MPILPVNELEDMYVEHLETLLGVEGEIDKARNRRDGVASFRSDELLAMAHDLEKIAFAMRQQAFYNSADPFTESEMDNVRRKLMHIVIK